MRVGLIIETLTHLSLALTTSPVLAAGIMIIFGDHAFVRGSTSVTVRQRAVPEALQGRGYRDVFDDDNHRPRCATKLIPRSTIHLAACARTN
jgi:hypothetical protein